MPIRQDIEIKSDGTKQAIWHAAAIGQVADKLKEQKNGASFPGFALAAALVDAEYAEARAALSSAVLREAARAGCDIGRSIGVYTKILKGKAIIEVEMPDLADSEP